MKKLIALCTFCLCLGLNAQEETLDEPRLESTAQDLQEIETSEEVNGPEPVITDIEEDVTKKMSEQETELEEKVVSENENTNEADHWYDFSGQQNRIQVRRDSLRQVRNASRYKMNTLLDTRRFAFGAFLEQTTKVTEIQSDPQILVGGRFSFVFNHHLNVGFAGYGLVSAVDWIPDENLDGDFLAMGYGGLMIEPEFAPQRIVHIGLPILLGAGGYGARDRDFDEFDEGDGFWVFEPGLNIDINVARFFKIGLGGSYRLGLGRAFWCKRPLIF